MGQNDLGPNWFKPDLMPQKNRINSTLLIITCDIFQEVQDNPYLGLQMGDFQKNEDFSFTENNLNIK
jgi:hypothetical protein